MSKKQELEELEPVLGTNPLAEMDARHGASFFGESGAAQPAEEQRPRRRRGRKSAKRKTGTPTHYKIVSISLYNEDIERIDGLVQEWKANGNPKANRSALIRYAIDQLDPDNLPKVY